MTGPRRQQIAHHPVHQPGRRHLSRGDLRKGDLEIEQAVVPALVDTRRLTGGPQEHAGEQVGQARVVLPIGHQAAQQIGPAQHWAVCRRGATNRDMVASAGTGVTPVQHELFRAKPGLVRALV